MISQYTFGKIRVNGRWHRHDLRISGGTVLPDWWRKNGHVCDIDDVAELLADSPDTLIIGQGKPGLMRATEQLKHHLQHHNIELIEQPTADAVATFNRLYKNKKVAAGFHLTC